jgi:hypothetical protein
MAKGKRQKVKVKSRRRVLFSSLKRFVAQRPNGKRAIEPVDGFFYSVKIKIINVE